MRCEVYQILSLAGWHTMMYRLMLIAPNDMTLVTKVSIVTRPRNTQELSEKSQSPAWMVYTATGMLMADTKISAAEKGGNLIKLKHAPLRHFLGENM